MSTRISPWPNGVPCWVDLGCRSVPDAQSFYAATLGWTYDPAEPVEAGYVLASVGGSVVAGLGPLRSPDQSVGWTMSFASDDVDATAAAITVNGGSLLMPPRDVGSFGRLVVAVDPAGATFGAWQAGAHIGAQRVNEPGALTWEDLRSTDPDVARTFYAAVFGHRTQPLEMAGPDYTTFHRGDDPAPLGGLGGLMGGPGPSHWLIYFGVADTDAAVAAAQRVGGSSDAPAFDSPFGRMAALRDPAGARFVVIQSGDTEQPDRSG